MKRLVFFAALMCLLLAGCTPTAPVVPDEPLSGQDKELVIAENGVTDFLLVISEDAPDTVSDSLPKFHKQLKKQTGATYSLDTDWTARGEEVDNSRLEILIGNTNRQATKDLLADLPEHSYGIRVTEDKVVIAGKNDSLTALAMYEFENNFFFGDEMFVSDGRFALPVGWEIIKTGANWDDPAYMIGSSFPVIASAHNPRTIHRPDGYKASQGAATDGTYVYTAYIRGDDDGDGTVGVVVKSLLSDLSLVKVSEELPIDHANSMTYNPDDNILVITNMDVNVLTVLDPETLEIVEQIHGGKYGFGGSYAIGYSTEKQQYVLKGGGKHMFLGRDFKMSNAVTPVSYSNSLYTAQGMDADGTYLYSIVSPGEETKDNLIIVHKWSGGHVQSVSIPISVEGEDLFHHDGKFYLSATDWSQGRAKVYELAFSYVYE